MENFKEYIDSHKVIIKNMSDAVYANKYAYDSVCYSFDFHDFISEICFARLYRQMNGKQISSNYLLKLPYQKTDEKEELDNIFMNYSKVFEDMKNMVCSVYDMEVHKTGYKNVKLITLTQKDKNLPFCLDYSLTLILFCMFRGMDREYHSIWRNNKKKTLAENVEDYIYEYSMRTDGSTGHDINDSVAKIFANNVKIKNIKKLVSKRYSNVLHRAFGLTGLVNNPNFYKYFSNIYTNDNSRWGNYAMQTNCFNFIEIVTNRIMMEENL